MKTVQLIDKIKYDQPVEELKSEAHQITIEIISRLSELDQLMPGDEYDAPGGIRIINRLCAVERRSRRAYRLLLDMASEQRSFSDSLDQLAKRHLNSKGQPTSRQSWLQNAQNDISLITEVWPEVGSVMFELLKRRDDSHS